MVLSILWGTKANAQQWKTLITETFESGASARSTNPAADILPGTTDYIVATSTTGGLSGVSDGSYTVGKTPAAPATTSNVWIMNAPDHTGNTDGYMMTINANPGRQGEANGTYYLYSTANFDVPGATYAIDFWGANILLPSLGNQFKTGRIGLSIRDAINTGGTQYASGTYVLQRSTSATVLPWQNESLSFSLPVDYAGARLYFNFYNNDTNQSTNGNDFVLDDLRIRMRVVTLSGNVYNDYNANGIKDGGEPGINGLTTPLYAYVTKANGQIVSKVQVDANGGYSFATDQGLPYSANDIGLKVIISSANVTGAITSTDIPGFALVSETDNNPTGINAGVTDGAMFVIRSDTDLSNANFGINEIPTAVTSTLPVQPNPGGGSSVSVPATSFQGNEVAGGQVSSLTIKSFPTNAESITINGTVYLASDPVWTADGVSIPADASGNPTQPIQVNPVNGTVDVVIPYTATDNLGLESAVANVTVPFSDLTIGGVVYSDGNAGVIDGTGTNVMGSNTLYANLTDNTGTTVIASVPVQPDGSYSFGTADGITANTDFQIVITNTQGTAGQPVPPTTLTNVVNTGEGNTGTTGDGTPDGKVLVNLGTTSQPGKDFGIDQLSTATPASTTIAQPVAGTEITLNGTGGNPPLPSATDPEDGTLGATNTIIINTIPANSDLFYNNVLVTNGQRIPNFDPNALKIVLTSATLGATNTSFQFSYEDVAGLPGSQDTYQLNWENPMPVTLIYFKGSINESAVALNWATSSEEQSDRFEIERSVNAKRWDKIGQASAAGYNTSDRLYQFIDETPVKGLNYYRLKMIDLDRTYTYSKTISLNVASGAEVGIYPNPGTDKLYLKGVDWNNVKSMELVNPAGVSVYQAKSAVNGVDISKLAPGIYVVVLTDTSNKVKTFKVVKQ